MDAKKLKAIIMMGESTTVQFKERVDDSYKIGCEFVAFSNSQGGLLVVGVNDKTGEITGLSYEEIQKTSNLLSNAASDNISPSITIMIETVVLDGKAVVAARVAQGLDKPYKDNKGIVWIKNGSDKRKVFSNERLRILMQSCGRLFADRDSVPESSFEDISLPTLKHFLIEKYRNILADDFQLSRLDDFSVENLVGKIAPGITPKQLLQNTSLMDKEGRLTLAGLLLLGKNILKFYPVFTIRCISFVGNDLSGDRFRDRLVGTDMEGNLLTQFKAAMAFVNRNLKSRQVEDEFNSLPALEIPPQVFVEFIVNALIHRDFYQTAQIRLLIFDNRVEIHSPGNLPMDVTEDTLLNGISKPRNQLLFDNAVYLLPYVGIGSGIVRAFKDFKDITIENNLATEEFVVTIKRPDEMTKPPIVVDNVVDNVVDKTPELSERQQRILNLIKEDRSISSAIISNALSVNPRTIQREILKLKSAGLISRIGPDNGGYWKVNVK